MERQLRLGVGHHTFVHGFEFPSEAAAEESYRGIAPEVVPMEGSGRGELFHTFTSDTTEHVASIIVETAPSVLSPNRVWLTSKSRRTVTHQPPSLEVEWTLWSARYDPVVSSFGEGRITMPVEWSDEHRLYGFRIKHRLVAAGKDRVRWIRETATNRREEELPLNFNTACVQFLNALNYGGEREGDEVIQLLEWRGMADRIQIQDQFPGVIQVPQPTVVTDTIGIDAPR
jgi:hypothetical protein